MLTSARVLRRTDGSRAPLGRPSIDVLLLSAAVQFGPRLIAVVLSGILRDGCAGIIAVRRSGGATIVWDYEVRRFPDMPTAAVELGRADLMLPVEQIGEVLQSSQSAKLIRGHQDRGWFAALLETATLAALPRLDPLLLW